MKMILKYVQLRQIRKVKLKTWLFFCQNPLPLHSFFFSLSPSLVMDRKTEQEGLFFYDSFKEFFGFKNLENVWFIQNSNERFLFESKSLRELTFMAYGFLKMSLLLTSCCELAENSQGGYHEINRFKFCV